MNVRPRGRRVAVALAGAATALALVAVAGCGGGDDSWRGSGRTPTTNTRVASSEIDSSNVADLSVASTEPLTGRGPFGFFAATPLIDEDGVAYVQDLAPTSSPTTWRPERCGTSPTTSR